MARKKIKSKYSPKAQKKIAKVMREFKENTLKSSSGKRIKNRDRAQAIALSEARQKGLKVPKKKKKTKKK